MPASDYVAGFLFFAPLLALTLAGAWLLAARRYPHLSGAERAVALGMIAVLGVLAVHIVPLTLGVLTRETALAAAALWLAAAVLVPAVGRSPLPAPSPSGSVDTAGRVLAGVAVAVAALLALAVARDQLFLASGAVDALNFHMPSVVGWLQSGSLWEIAIFLPDAAVGHYPNNGDVFLLAATLPWSNDFLAHLALYPVYALTGVALYSLARELRAPAAAAAVPAAVLLTIPAVLIPTLIGSYTDILALFGFATGILFLVRHDRTGVTAELVLAGLSLGVAFGSKWYAVPEVAMVVAVWMLASLIAGRGWRSVGGRALAIVALIALSGGIWLLRNWVESGNPLFPVRIAPLGIEVFDAPPDVIRDAAGFTLLGYLDDPEVWGDFIWPQLRDALAGPALLLIAGMTLAAVIFVSRGRRKVPARGLVFAGVVAAALILLVYAGIPYTAGGPEGSPTLAGPSSRYAVPALLIAAPICAWVASRIRHGTAVLGALGMVAIGDAAVQISDSTLSGASIDRNDWLAAAAFLIALALGTWAVGRLSVRLVGRRRQVALAGAACATLVAAAVAGYEAQKRFNGVRYVGQDPTIDYVLTRVPRGERVGLAGVWDNGIPPVLPSFGPRLDNRVVYVGRDDDDILRRYTDRREFLRALGRGSYDYLFVGRGIPPQRSLREERWAESAGFDPVARSERLTLLEAPTS